MGLIYGSAILLGVLIGLSGGQVNDTVEGIIWIMLIVPHTVLHVKRCHDLDRSGWFMLVALIPLVNIWYMVEITCYRGTEGYNRFGPDPLSYKQVRAEQHEWSETNKA